MRAQGVWDAVESDDPSKVIHEKKDQMALAAIYQSIPEDTLVMIAEKQTAKEAWEALKTMHLGDDRIKEARVQTLKSEFEKLQMKESESVDDFALRLTTIINGIRALGEKFEDTYAIKKFLRAVPSKFLHIASAIEQFGDLKTMTVEEVIGRLKAHEERLRDYSNKDEDDGHLLLTRSKWMSRERNRVKSTIRCWNCQEIGHFKRDCRDPKKELKAEVHHTVGKVDDEPELL